jgi:peptidoglycan/LPS O-acetylase OafA/YrhL
LASVGAHQEERAVSGRQLPALDGVRAVAVLAVMGLHLNFGFLSGGYLGVDLFFVLSGFLITTLLLEERSASGRISLGRFWERRAGRLLPALGLVIVAVLGFQLLKPSPALSLSRLNGDALSALLYIANWHAIYFDKLISPLKHTWSLGVEEQFYLFWPLILVVVLRARRWRTVGLWLCGVGAIASAVEMGLLFRPGLGQVRAYGGTDTEAFNLLLGAALGFLVASRPQPSARNRKLLHIAGLASAGVIGVFLATAGAWGFPKAGMYHGGFQLFAVLAAVMVADARLHDPGAIGRVLSLRPVRWIGTVSYGLYLWHGAIFFTIRLAWPRLSTPVYDVLCLVLSFGAATLSYYLVERPVRRWVATGAARSRTDPVSGYRPVLEPAALAD